MGRYTTIIADNAQYEEIINTVRNGYNDGTKHRPNDQIATILVLQANLGCRINDIIKLEMENIVKDGDGYKLDLIEQKTKKHRFFVIPKPVKRFIDDWTEYRHIKTGRLFNVTDKAVWKCLNAVTKYLGISNFSCHSLRKMAALDVYENSGKDLALTSQFLNHASSSTTLLYLKRSTKQLDEVLSKSSRIA